MAEWLTVKSAAEQLGKSERTIRRWIEKDTIPHKKTLDGIVVDVDGRDRPPPPPAPPDDKLSTLIAENERLKAENELLRGERDWLRLAHEESLKTTRLLIAARTQAKSDDDNDTTQAGTPPRPWYKFW